MTPVLEESLHRELERLLGAAPQGRELARVGGALRKLHERFVAEGAPETALAPYLSDRTSLAAYLAYFFPASVAQVARVLVEIEPPASQRVRVLDVGSGPGPAGMAAAAWLRSHGRMVELTSIDAAAAALQALERIWPRTWGTVATRTWTAGQPLPAGPFDLIVASHALNELFASQPDRLARRTELALDLASRLSSEGVLVLVEPALRRTGREMLELRDTLLTKGLSVRAPCLFRGPCPALERPRDWCHADRPWEPPPLVSSVANAAGLARDSLKYSYVIFSNAPVPEGADPARFRIVSEPLREKGKLRFFGCGSAGRHPLIRLDKAASEANADFASLERGDVVRLHELRAAGDGLRIDSATEVRVDRAAVRLDSEAAS